MQIWWNKMSEGINSYCDRKYMYYYSVFYILETVQHLDKQEAFSSWIPGASRAVRLSKSFCCNEFLTAHLYMYVCKCKSPIVE